MSNYVAWNLTCYTRIKVHGAMDVRFRDFPGVYRIYPDGTMMRHDGGDPGDEQDLPGRADETG